MEKKTAGLLGVIAGLATMNTAQAAINPAPAARDALQVSSYAELLSPIPNASVVLKASDAEQAQNAASVPGATLEEVQYYGGPPPYYHHHHHHHHRYYHHHHHHHHHHGATIFVPGVGGFRTD